MADENDLLLFTQFLKQFGERKPRTSHVRSNPLEDYDDDEFRQRFRLSKTTVERLLDEVINNPVRSNYIHYCTSKTIAHILQLKTCVYRSINTN